MTEKHAPKIIGRITFPNRRMRAYIHGGGIENFDTFHHEGLNAALSHFNPVLSKYIGSMVDENTNYSLAMIWHDGETGVVDFFRYSGLDLNNWPSNPEMDSFVFKDGLYVPGKPVTCGDGTIILGLEEQFRRKTKNLDEFSRNSPKIPGVELELELELDGTDNWV